MRCQELPEQSVMILNKNERYSTKMKEEFYFKSSDKKTKIHAVMWKPEGKPRAVLQISHGMIEYIERYDDFANFLNKAGILVVGNDHLGHGKSVTDQSEWGYFAPEKGGAIVCRDLLKLTKKVKKSYPDIPYFLLGHSMGSFMARRYIINYGEMLDGVIVMGTGNQPMPLLMAGRALSGVLGKIYGDHHRSRLAAKISFGAYNKRINNPASPNAWLSRDEEQVNKYDNTPECTFLFTVKGFDQMFETIEYVENSKHIEHIPKDLPIMVISGTEDPVGAYRKDVRKVYDAFCKAGITDVTLTMIEGARHEVLNETDRQETYEKILDWLNERIK